LGLLSSFQRANCFTSSSFEPLLRFRFAIRFSYLHSVSPLSNFFFLNRYSLFFFCSPPPFAFASGSSEGGNLYIDRLKFVKALFPPSSSPEPINRLLA